METCLYCNIKLEGKFNKKFCSRSHAATYNNLNGPPKHKPSPRTCKTCNNIFYMSKSHRTKHFCPDCLIIKNNTQIRTIDHYYQLDSIKGKHPSWKNAHIRQFARHYNKELLKQPCFKCGYSIHVELAHIKPVSSFPMTATVAEVNAKENLVQLCRNCHWEFDHGLLKL